VSSPTDQHWSKLYEQGRDFRLISSNEIDRFLQHISSDTPKTNLDLGSGTGQLTRELYHRGYNSTGIDTSREAVRRAQHLTQVPSEYLSYVHKDLESDSLQLNPKDSRYSLITCKLVYAFIKDKPSFLKKVANLLAPKGIFVVITPMLEDVEENKKDIAVDENAFKLLEAYFNKAEVYKLNGLTYFVGTTRQ
jgi:2-polyprenyl-3-methyl-5-hydroxy-6-metoxy-1,4-benzoquinol methylase